jgi:hypothetical protein
MTYEGTRHLKESVVLILENPKVIQLARATPKDMSVDLIAGARSLYS